MRVNVDQDLCVSCGACVSICPEVFDWGEEEKAVAKLKEVPDDIEETAHEAVESCPTAAILES